MKRQNKAISPIFATLIILAVVTVLFIPIFIWATGTTSETEDSWEISGQIATERIIIEEVSLKAGTSACTIYVRNIGKTAVTVDNVFISLADNSGELHVYSKSDFSASPTSVVQGDLITVTFSNIGFTPASNQTYLVKAFTTRGVGDTYQVVT
jgi:flagellin-like protein